MRRAHISAAALLLAAVFALSSCGIIIINRPGETSGETTKEPDDGVTTGGEYTEKTDPDETSHRVVEVKDYLPEAEGYLNEISLRDFDGVKMFIASPDTALLETSEDNIYNASVEKRNDMVEKRYNTSIYTVLSDADSIISELKKADSSGDFFADMVLIPTGRLGEFAVSGLMMNLRSLPYTDYEKPYFCESSLEQCTVKSKTFAVAGDGCQSVESMYGVFFNKKLAKELGLASLYSRVYDSDGGVGEWTWERFFSYSKRAVNAGYAGYSSTLDESGAVVCGFISSGSNFTTNVYGELPMRTFNKPSVDSLLGWVRELVYKKTYASERIFGADSSDEFAEAELLFCIDKVSSMRELKNAGFAWGVLPLPAADELQEQFGTYVGDGSMLFAAPLSTPNVDNTGIIIQALNAASYGHIRGSFDSYMTLEVICDTDTLAMLDIIRKNAVYDFASMFSPAVKQISSATVSAFITAASGKKDLTSLYTAAERDYLNYMNRTFK